MQPVVPRRSCDPSYRAGCNAFVMESRPRAPRPRCLCQMEDKNKDSSDRKRKAAASVNQWGEILLRGKFSVINSKGIVAAVAAVLAALQHYGHHDHPEQPSRERITEPPIATAGAGDKWVRLTGEEMSAATGNLVPSTE